MDVGFTRVLHSIHTTKCRKRPSIGRSSTKVGRKIKILALNYFLLEEQLYSKGFDGQLLRCLGKEAVVEVTSQSYEGIYGAHQVGIKIIWLLRRYGYYWPITMADCISHAKSCRQCQRLGPLKRVLATELHPIIKPWPFR